MDTAIMTMMNAIFIASTNIATAANNNATNTAIISATHKAKHCGRIFGLRALLNY